MGWNVDDPGREAPDPEQIKQDLARGSEYDRLKQQYDALKAKECRKVHMPGSMARHAIISDECRRGHGSIEAFNVAVGQLREAYVRATAGYPIGKDIKLHVMLSIERPPRPEVPKGDDDER